MIIEQIIFNGIAIILLIVFLFKMIKRNETVYLGILIIQAIGICINFCYALFKMFDSTLPRIIVYLFAIIIPIILIYIEKRGKSLTEILYMNLSYTYTLFKNNKKSKKILTELIKKYPKNYKAYKLLANIYEKEGGFRKAIEFYVKVLEIDKSDYESYYKIAYLLSELKQNEESIEMLTQLLKVKPESIMARTLLGELLIEKESFKEALNTYLETLNYIKDDHNIYYNLGIVYARLNDFQNSKKYYEKAIELKPDLYNAYYNLAQIYLIYHEQDKAEETFKKTLEGELKYFAYFELAKIYISSKRKEEAIEFLNISLKNYPKIIEQIENEPMFLTIRNNLITIEKNQNNIDLKISKKEINVKKHLDDTYKIIGKLNCSDKDFEDT